MNFNAFDLNLLRVFEAMMREMNATRAGESLGLSQPAVSAALARLRHATGDPLFVRQGRLMAPTAQAVAMRGPIRDSLRRIEGAISEVAGFQAASAERVFTIAGSDYVTTLFGPRLAADCARGAPGVTIRMRDAPPGSLIERLGEDGADLFIDVDRQTPDWISKDLLHASGIVTVAARGYPGLVGRVEPGGRIPPRLFCALPHVMRLMDGALTGTVDPVLARHGLSRRVAMTVPYFEAVALVAAAGECLGGLPERYAASAARRLALDIYLPPFDPPKLDVCAFRHHRHDRDAGIAWLRERVAEAARA